MAWICRPLIAFFKLKKSTIYVESSQGSGSQESELSEGESVESHQVGEDEEEEEEDEEGWNALSTKRNNENYTIQSSLEHSVESIPRLDFSSLHRDNKITIPQTNKAQGNQLNPSLSSFKSQANFQRQSVPFCMECKDHPGCSAVHWAAYRGHIPCLEYLISSGNSGSCGYDQNRRTPLHYACESGNAECAALLVDSHFEWVDVADKQGILSTKDIEFFKVQTNENL